MNKLLIVLVTLHYCSLGYAQIINFPDEEFKTVLINAGFDTNGDSEIDQNEALSVEKIEIPESEVSDLTGITFFSNCTKLDVRSCKLTDQLDLSNLEELRILDCSNNEITNVYLNELAKTEFTWLALYDNPIAAFDFSEMRNLHSLFCNNTNLESIYLSYTSSLSKLRIDQNPSLESFSISTANEFKDIDLSGLPNLKKFSAYDCAIEEIDFYGCPLLEEVNLYYNSFRELEFSDFENLKKLRVGKIRMLGELTLRNLPSLEFLDFSDCDNLIHLTIDNINHPQYEISNISGNSLRTLSLNNVYGLKELNYSDTKINSVELQNLPDLETLVLFNNKIQNIDLENLNHLDSVNLSNNFIKEIDLSSCTELKWLDIHVNNFSSIDLSNNKSIEYFKASSNQFVNLDLRELAQLEYLTAANNVLTEINLSGVSNLIDLNLRVNELTQIDLKDQSNLEKLQLDNNDIVSFSGRFDSLYTATFFNNILSSFEIDAQRLDWLDLELNKLSDIRLNTPKLRSLTLGYNKFEKFQYNGLEQLQFLHLENNAITSIEAYQYPTLKYIGLQHTPISVFDARLNPHLDVTDLRKCDDLEVLFFKNGFWNLDIRLEENFNLKFICADSIELEVLKEDLEEMNFTGIITDECDYFTVPGYITIKGSATLDVNNDGVCDDSDINIPYPKIHIESENLKYDGYGNQTGNYQALVLDEETSFSLSSFVDTFQQVLPDEYRFIPDSSFINESFDFCVLNNRLIEDLEIAIIADSETRPGFNTSYKIRYSNKGNASVSGDILFIFEEEYARFISSDPTANVELGDTLTYVFNDLLPYESRYIDLEFILNSPTDIPPLNDGDQLKFIAKIFPEILDRESGDNCVEFLQTIINSYDPNDKTCLEGMILNEDMIGDFVHYLIRFENEGSASAVNVKVLDEIDTTVFDINSLLIVEASHEMTVSVIEGNLVEFLFQNIYLSVPDSTNVEINKGFVLFKIKTNDDVKLNDKLENQAQIYFDFNFPIITNTATSYVASDNDGDGFYSHQDCDDENEDINPMQTEIPYNGVDDDCDMLTLDDDLDQDGFGIELDCDDYNADINPDAIEIPGNGIDDNCNGFDGPSSASDSALDHFLLYPNPTNHTLKIQGQTESITKISIHQSDGKVLEQFNEDFEVLDVSFLANGLYFILIETSKQNQFLRFVKQ